MQCQLRRWKECRWKEWWLFRSAAWQYQTLEAPVGVASASDPSCSDALSDLGLILNIRRSRLLWEWPLLRALSDPSKGFLQRHSDKNFHLRRRPLLQTLCLIPAPQACDGRERGRVLC